MSNNSFTSTKSYLIEVPIKNKGKFRWKNKENSSNFGKVFSTENIPYTSNSYLERQIGYDRLLSKEEKSTIEKDINKYLIFHNNKGVAKYPFELSNYLIELHKLGIIKSSDIEDIKTSIEKYDNFLMEEKEIKYSSFEDFSISNFNMKQSNILLPTYIYEDRNNLFNIEISIQKQQYATGVQPMLYFCIPLSSFNEYNLMLGKKASELDFKCAHFEINENNKSCILTLFKLFAACSKSHNSDISSMLCSIDNYLDILNKK